MPVRIYDIAKKLGIESKEVLVKAKELGIKEARVPSSSLDKITAEYLENHLKPAAPPPPPAAPVAPEPIVVLTQPPEMPQPALQESWTEAAPPGVPLDEPPPAALMPPALAPPESPAGSPMMPAAEAKAPLPEPVPPPPALPPAPSGPRLGDKVGFIQLPPRGSQRATDKPSPVKPPARPVPPGRPELPRPRGDTRLVRPGLTPARTPVPPARPATPVAAKGPEAPAAPGETKAVLPADAPVITLKPPLIVRDLAEQLKIKPFKLIADLIDLKVMANVNQAIDEAIAQKICAKYGFRFEVEKRERGAGLVHAPVRKIEVDEDDKAEDLKPRAPVITIMGHVDHGKTTLLDAIRKSDVAAHEAGGITQHIGAYTISFPHPERKDEPRQITFLDTPGHAAFSAMRARGANVTDLVVLVVAANDGVMPQTLEALNHALAAKVPIIVAINKCDHPNANALKVRQQLQERGLVPDDWGGETPFVEVSALTKQGVDHLLEMILLRAELMELKANPSRRAKGNVIESGLEPGGPTATVLVRKGTLRVGEILLCGPYYGRVRALIDEEGQRLKEAGPSVAVKVLGLNGVPEAGLEFVVVEHEKDARAEGQKRVEEARSAAKDLRAKVTLENLFDTLASASAKVLKIVVKADTQGSVEAIVDALKKIESEKVSLEVIHSAVGTITENDVHLASASQAIILGFHTRIDGGVADAAKHEGVQIKLYSIIYELIDEVKLAMAGLLEPELKEVVIGSAEVRKIFALSKGGNVAGCVVSSGRIVRGKTRVVRRKGLIFQGNMMSLRRFQDEVNEVRAGMECGIRIEAFDDFQAGDLIECFTVEKVQAKL